MTKKVILPKPDSAKTVTGVWLKDEHEEHGHCYGPIGFTYAEKAPKGVFGRPYDPNREPDPWFSDAQAQRLADSLGVPFEIV